MKIETRRSFETVGASLLAAAYFGLGAAGDSAKAGHDVGGALGLSSDNAKGLNTLFAGRTSDGFPHVMGTFTAVLAALAGREVRRLRNKDGNDGEAPITIPRITSR